MFGCNQTEDSPVCEVKPEAKDGRKRLLHRNLLLPCDFLPLTPQPRVKHIPKTSQKKGKSATQTSQRTEQFESDSDDPEILFHVPPDPTKPEDKPEDNDLDTVELAGDTADQPPENILEPDLDTQLEDQHETEPPFPPRRSTRIRFAPNPLTYNHLGNPEHFVSSINATPTYPPLNHPQSYPPPIPPPFHPPPFPSPPFMPPPWFYPTIPPIPYPYYPPVIHRCPCWNLHCFNPFNIVY